MLRERQVPDEVIARLKPWAALANFTVTPEDYEKITLDQKLIGLAPGQKLRVLGLEGIEEQISVFERNPFKYRDLLLDAFQTQHAKLLAVRESDEFLIESNFLVVLGCN